MGTAKTLLKSSCTHQAANIVSWRVGTHGTSRREGRLPAGSAPGSSSLETVNIPCAWEMNTSRRTDAGTEHERKVVEIDPTSFGPAAVRVRPGQLVPRALQPRLPARGHAARRFR